MSWWAIDCLAFSSHGCSCPSSISVEEITPPACRGIGSFQFDFESSDLDTKPCLYEAVSDSCHVIQDILEVLLVGLALG